MIKTKVVLWGLEKMQTAASNLLGGLIKEKEKVHASRETIRLGHVEKTQKLSEQLALKQLKLDEKVAKKFQGVADKKSAIQTQIESIQSKVNG